MTVKVRTFNGMVLFEGCGFTEPYSERSALSLLKMVLRAHPETVVIGGSMSIGPVHAATGEVAYAAVSNSGEMFFGRPEDLAEKKWDDLVHMAQEIDMEM